MKMFGMLLATGIMLPMMAVLPVVGGENKLEYEFPEGVPFDAGKVTWYTPTDQCQDGQMKWKHLSNQSWNQEVPWINAGLEKSPNVKTFKFRQFGKGTIKKWTEHERYFSNGGDYARWSYPAGTVFGEVIQADGRTVEVFTLEFTEEGKDPTFHRYRPFGKRSEIAEFIVKENVKETRFVDNHGRKRKSRQIGRFGENMTDVLAYEPVLDVKGLEHEIELTKDGIETVLNRPFKDVIDIAFSEAVDGLKSYGPTTKQRNGITPVDSKAGLFASKDCLTCHKTAGAEGRLLDPDPVPDKYGAIRGGGKVFSFTPDLAKTR